MPKINYGYYGGPNVKHKTSPAFYTSKCCLCDGTALRRVGTKGYCKKHTDVAFKLKAVLIQERDHKTDEVDHYLDRKDRTEMQFRKFKKVIDSRHRRKH